MDVLSTARTSSKASCCEYQNESSRFLGYDQATQQQALFDPQEHVNRIMILPVEGGNIRERASFSKDEGISALAWNPNGNELWYLRETRSEDPQRQVWRIPVDGEEEPQPLALKSEGLRALQFHHDGRLIAYIAGEQKHELWVIEGFLPDGEGMK